MTKIAASFWRATTRRVVKLRPSRTRSTSYSDRLFRIAAEQEVGVQRMRIAAGDRSLCGDQSLRQHLPAEHPLPAVVRGEAGKAVLSRGREVKEGDKVDGAHAMGPQLANDGGARDAPRQRRRLPFTHAGKPVRHPCADRDRDPCRAFPSAAQPWQGACDCKGLSAQTCPFLTLKRPIITSNNCYIGNEPAPKPAGRRTQGHTSTTQIHANSRQELIETPADLGRYGWLGSLT